MFASDSDTDESTDGAISDDADALSELDIYLRKRTVPKVKEPLAWWDSQRATFPHLAQMAIDYLSIPGASFRLLSMTPSLLTQLYQRHLSKSNVSSAKAGLS